MIDCGCKETLCTNCSHREVCSFKDQFLEAQKAVDNIEVSRPSAEINSISLIRLSNISWIKPVELVCKHYTKTSPQIKENVR